SEDTFGSALIEAWLYLTRHPGVPVLLVYFDEALPAALASTTNSADTCSSIALLITTGADSDIVVQRRHNAGADDGSDPGMSFMQFFLSGASHGSCITRRTCWQWSRQ